MKSMGSIPIGPTLPLLDDVDFLSKGGLVEQNFAGKRRSYCDVTLLYRLHHMF